MEEGSSALGGSYRTPPSRGALPARNQQVEQNRTPDVFLYYPELARTTVGQLSNYRQSYRQHQDQSGTQDQSAVDAPEVSQENQDRVCRNGQAQPCARPIPR